MGKMIITAYTDGDFNSECKSALELPVNPAKVKLSKGIRYAEDKQLGSLNGSNVYVRYQPETFSFDCLFDMTNAMEDDDEKKPVHDAVNELEQSGFTITTPKDTALRSLRYNTVTSPFSANSKTLETEYSLFDPDSIPLRAELKVTLTGYCSQKEEKKHFSKHSPDVSRLVTLKEGQTLSALCYEVYGDPLLVGQVARFNNLNGYRNIPAGTEILLPMLKKA